MIFTDLIYIFTCVGIVVGAVGAGFLGMFGFCVLYELIGDEYNHIREQVSWSKWKRSDEQLLLHHLDKLATRYPDLEITYKKK